MTDIKALVKELRRDAADYGRYLRGKIRDGEIISWDQRAVRAWEAADALEQTAAERDEWAGRCGDAEALVDRMTASERFYSRLTEAEAERDRYRKAIEDVGALLDSRPDDRDITWWQWTEGGLGGSLHNDLRRILTAALQNGENDG